MLQKKIIKRIPGKLLGPPPQENQGYIDDLSKKLKPELLEILDRQDKLLANSAFIKKLPDKGKRISEFRKRIAEELARRDEINKTCDLFSGLNIGKSGTSDEIEWTGKYSQDNRVGTLDSDDESEEEKDPLRILASQSGVGTYKKKHKVVEPEPSLIKPEDLKDIDSSVITESTSKQDEEIYVRRLCNKVETVKEISGKATERFLPHRTVKSSHHNAVEGYKKPLGPHWEVTAATPPPPVHGDAKLISLQESLNLQKEQASKLKDIQAKHAAERLASQLGVKMGSTLPDASLRATYRDTHTDSSSSSEDEMINSDGEHEEEEPEKDGAVIYNLVDP
ncbi:hypothetical protein C0J52_26230 [Blattella germanica]|nr:hypothetical protein C0J52_26230 [Blattella germanica]